MMWLFCIAHYIVFIAMWVSIIGLMRAKKIERSPALAIHLFFTVIFLVLAIKFSLIRPIFYLIGAILNFIFSTFILSKSQPGWRRWIDMLISFLFWPEAIAFAMFLHFIKEDEKNT